MTLKKKKKRVITGADSCLRTEMPWLTTIIHWRLWSEEGVAADNFEPNPVQSEGVKYKVQV